MFISYPTVGDSITSFNPFSWNKPLSWSCIVSSHLRFIPSTSIFHHIISLFVLLSTLCSFTTGIPPLAVSFCPSLYTIKATLHLSARRVMTLRKASSSQKCMSLCQTCSHWLELRWAFLTSPGQKELIPILWRLAWVIHCDNLWVCTCCPYFHESVNMGKLPWSVVYRKV